MRAVLRLIYSIAAAGIILSALVSIVVPEASAVGALACLVAFITALPLVQGRQRIIGLVLVTAGAGFLLWAVLLGHAIEPAELLLLNQDIVAMLAAVAMLGFVARTADAATPRLRGTAAVVRTLGLTHVLGALVNMSAITIVADRLRSTGGLHPANVQLVTRGFAAAGVWSPLWAGAALALAILPGANTAVVMLVGLVLAIAVLAITVPTILRELGSDLPTYRGYALSWPLLRVPLALAALVLGLHLALPDVLMPRIIVLSVLLVTAAWAALPRPQQFPERFWGEIRRALPATTGEPSLFVGAGIMAIGLSALLAESDIVLPVDDFTVPVAWATIVAMTIGVLIGVHQVISIGLLAAVLLPLEPDPTLFMSAIMIGWGTAIAIGPLAGTQLYLQGRYGVPAARTVRQNLPYLAAMLVLAWPALWVVDLLA